jgi:hypothetical protein
MPVPPSKPFSEFSDDEFYEHLRSSVGGGSWSLAELVEVERRGYEFLDRDPELRIMIEATKERFLESMRGALKPLTDNIREIGKKLAQDSSAKSFKLLSEQWAKSYSDVFKLKSPFSEALAKRTSEAPWLLEDKRNKEVVRKFGEELASKTDSVSDFDVTRVTGPLGPDQTGRPATDPETIELVKGPFERLLKEETENRLMEVLNQINEHTRNTSVRVRFGWQQWVILIASVIAAVASVLSIIRHP